MLAGVFVGGAGSRMGGVAKGLLRAPDGQPIVVRTVRMLSALGIPCVLVGAHAAYAEVAKELDVPVIADAPVGIGPLGGLVGLLQHAMKCVQESALPHSLRAADQAFRVLTIGSDMPYLTSELLIRLCAAPAAQVVAPRIDGRWQPLFARLDVAVALPVAMRRAADNQRALHGLLEELNAQDLLLSLDEAMALRDWDFASDVEEQ